MTKDEAWDITLDVLRNGLADNDSVIAFMKSMDGHIERPADEWRRIKEKGISADE